MDLMQFLDGLRREKTLKKDFKKSLGPVSYHTACHLRAQKIAYPGMRVLGLVPDTDVRLVEQCSAVDGTWGMKAEYYEMGRKYAQKLASDDHRGRSHHRRGSQAAGGQRLRAGRRCAFCARPGGACCTRWRPSARPMVWLRRQTIEVSEELPMKKVKRDELLDLGAYEQIRERFRAAVIEEKKNRRFSVSDELSIVFENHTTVLFQIQEMLRTERITPRGGDPARDRYLQRADSRGGRAVGDVVRRDRRPRHARAPSGRARRPREQLCARRRRQDLSRAQRDARGAAGSDDRGPLRKVSPRRRRSGGDDRGAVGAAADPRRGCACVTHTSRSRHRYRPRSRAPSPRTCTDEA